MSNIHPTAVVDATAEIAPSAMIGPYCVIGPDVTIGDDTVLHNHVAIQSLTTIGRGNQIFPFSVIGADPQDRKFNGEPATCTIGNDNIIREHVTIHRGTENGGGVTTVGDHNLIMVAAHIAHDCQVEDDVIIANQVMLAGHVHVCRGANIGGGVGVHHFATIGALAMVGGLARIPKDVPPFMIVEGNPAEVRGVNFIAMTRKGYEPGHIEAVKDAYKRLYRDNGAPMSERLTNVRDRYCEIEAVCHLCDSITASSNGVHGRALEKRRHDDKRAVEVKAESPARSAAAATS